MTDEAIRIRGVTKAFGRNKVLRGIDLTLPAGRVTVLMGANGAGKSTLVKILCGVHASDTGTVTLGAAPFTPASPQEALRAGVVTVHQNINDGVVPDLDVASNLLLDDLAAGGATFLRRRAMRDAARAMAEAVGLDIDLSRPVAEVSIADRQLIAIARALSHRPRLLILDEPTSSLSVAETGRLFALIDRLRDDGVAILYISHRMSDIRRLADRIVAMRDGLISATFEKQAGGSLDYASAVRAMLDHEMTEVDITIPPPGAPVLRLDRVVLRDGARPIGLTLHAGEVVALTGLVGSGKSALAGALYGLGRPVSGTVTLAGRPFAPRDPAEAIAAGVFMSPKDRLANAVVRDFDISRNITLPFTARHSRLDVMRRASETALARRMIAGMGIVCQSPRDGIMTLSGGNQQKVVVARWMAEACRLLILDEPFQGVDIQARRDLGRRIRDSAAGRATLVLCAELDEALELADRILVMSEHAIVGDHRNEDIDVNAIMDQVVDAAHAEARA